MGLLGAVAAGVVVTKGAMDFYEEYKDRANNTEQPGDDDNELVQPTPQPRSCHADGTAAAVPDSWHQEEEMLLEGMPNQSGEYTVAPLITLIAKAAGELGNIIFSENNNRENFLDRSSLNYVPTPKHDKLGGWGSKMDLSDAEAKEALDNSIQNGKQRIWGA